MKDKDILELLGLTDRTIQVGLVADIENIANNGYEKYLNEIEEHEKEKKKYIDMFKDSYVYGKIKNTLIRDGFIYRCPFCLDVSHQYMKPKKNK